MRRRLALIGHGAIVLVASYLSDSAAGFLLTACGMALLLDRYALRVLPWSPVVPRKEICLRGGAVLAGAVVF